MIKLSYEGILGIFLIIIIVICANIPSQPQKIIITNQKTTTKKITPETTIEESAPKQEKNKRDEQLKCSPCPDDCFVHAIDKPQCRETIYELWLLEPYVYCPYDCPKHFPVRLSPIGGYDAVSDSEDPKYKKQRELSQKLSALEFTKKRYVNHKQVQKACKELELVLRKKANFGK